MAHPERRHKISMEEGIRFQGGPQQRYCPFITKESSDQQFHNAGMNFPHTRRGHFMLYFPRRDFNMGKNQVRPAMTDQDISL